MPRNSRKSIQTEYLHVMTQGINKSYIFQKDEDIKYYIKIMYEIKKEYNIQIIAYCIMNNHAHILIKTESIEKLSRYMQRMNTKYGKYYNKKYGRVGFVFRNRFKSEGIYSEEHLYNCINYIYENPVKAGICKHASDYKYSNYKKINTIITEKSYVFLETEEEMEKECKTYIEKYKNENCLNNIKNQKELITVLKDQYNISYRKIAKYLNINREKVRKMYEK